jgi:hypothetical protein
MAGWALLLHNNAQWNLYRLSTWQISVVALAVGEYLASRVTKDKNWTMNELK